MIQGFPPKQIPIQEQFEQEFERSTRRETIKVPTKRKKKRGNPARRRLFRSIFGSFGKGSRAVAATWREIGELIGGVIVAGGCWFMPYIGHALAPIVLGVFIVFESNFMGNRNSSEEEE